MTFWKICAAWCLVLLSVVALRVGAGGPAPAERGPSMPEVGTRLQLDGGLVDADGREIEAVADSGLTVYLITSTGCAACQRELLNDYPTRVPTLAEAGHEFRWVTMTSAPADDDWFMARVPDDAAVIIDTQGFVRGQLRVGVTPSVLVLNSDSTVVGAFSPSREWPVDAGTLAAIGGAAK